MSSRRAPAEVGCHKLDSGRILPFFSYELKSLPQAYIETLIHPVDTVMPCRSHVEGGPGLGGE